MGGRPPRSLLVVSRAETAAPVAKVEDTTGAGDLYAAGFLYGVATGNLLVQHFTLPARFTATGLDHGSIVWESYSATSVHYQ